MSKFPFKPNPPYIPDPYIIPQQKQKSNEMKTPEKSDLIFESSCTTSAGPTLTFYIPKKEEWEWCLGNDWRLRFSRVTPPCLIHRIMQRLCLGIYWRKITNENT